MPVRPSEVTHQCKSDHSHRPFEDLKGGWVGGAQAGLSGKLPGESRCGSGHVLAFGRASWERRRAQVKGWMTICHSFSTAGARVAGPNRTGAAWSRVRQNRSAMDTEEQAAFTSASEAS